MKKKFQEKKKLELNKFTVLELDSMNKINAGKNDGPLTPHTYSEKCHLG
jgi:hypothetical protein